MSTEAIIWIVVVAALIAFYIWECYQGSNCPICKKWTSRNEPNDCDDQCPVGDLLRRGEGK